MKAHRTFFGDAEHDFNLGADQILELERVTGAGIGALCQRLFAGSFGYRDLTETLRLALIGGGLDPQEASSLVTAYVSMQPMMASMALAVDVLSVLYFGDGTTDTGREPEQPGELDSEALA